MKENKLIKQATDRQMPDLEKIRANVLNQEKSEPNKIVRLKPTKLLAAASVAIIAIAGTVAAVAAANGGFFFKPPMQSVASADEATKEQPTTAAATEQKKEKKEVKATKPAEPDEKEIKRKLIDTMGKHSHKVSWLHTIGEAEGYEIVYAANNTNDIYNCSYIIGSYTFESTTQHRPDGLGLYVVNNDDSYTLAEAYKLGLFKDFDEVVKLIESRDDEIDYDFTIRENQKESELFKSRFGSDILTIAELGESGDAKLYYNVSGYASDENAVEKIGEVTITAEKTKHDYALGVYAIANDRLYTLAEAFDEGVLTNMEEVESLINENTHITGRFTFVKEEPSTTVEEETTEPATEEETGTE